MVARADFCTPDTQHLARPVDDLLDPAAIAKLFKVSTRTWGGDCPTSVAEC